MIRPIDEMLGIGGQPPVSDMPFTTPQFSRKQVNRAGVAIAQAFPPNWWHNHNNVMEYYHNIDIINNWRSSHSGPLLYLRLLLTNHSRRVDSGALIAQRIKRLSSIEAKLARFPTMTLSQMQDIGGCRAIVDSVKSVELIAENMQKSRTQHQFNGCDDYIKIPQSSGYRGIHLIYRFHSDSELKPCNGLKIEVQIRSLLQHAWATAVETVGTLTRQALKSSQGESEWLRFFELMGTVVAIEEGTARVANTPQDDKELLRDIEQYAENLAIINRLESFRQALKQTEQMMTADARYFLLELDPSAGGITISGFRARELFRATDLYAEAEKRIAQSGGDAVLVSVDSISTLRRAYPNYFLDTEVFLGLLHRVLEMGL